jgi:hypothetical protein
VILELCGCMLICMDGDAGMSTEYTSRKEALDMYFWLASLLEEAGLLSDKSKIVR